MKLNPTQIGVIAHYCQQVIAEFPIEPPTQEDFDDVPKHDEIEMETWEVRLKHLINSNSALPDYDDHEVNVMVDFFMDYHQ